PVEPLPREDPRELVADPLVLAEQIPDLAPAAADVARRYVRVGADVPAELRHEALAEAHHLVVALPFRIEIRSALPAAHRQRCQRGLAHLVERQKLQDAEIHGRMKPQTPLYGP